MTYGINFTPWTLCDQLQFDLSTLPTLDQNSIIFLASPNNPTGSVLKQQLLIELLIKHPKSLFIIDEVYHEFDQNDNTPILKKFNNLVLIRSFSKSFMTAGIRFGYCISAPDLRQQLEKVILPFSINHFAACTVDYLLKEDTWKTINFQNISLLISERERMYSEIKSMSINKNLLTVYPSKANFLLIRLACKDLHIKLVRLFNENRIAILDTSNQSLIPNSIRISIGTEHENQRVMEVFNKFFNLN
jgi:histidinol-phosphate aminotransferase